MIGDRAEVAGLVEEVIGQRLTYLQPAHLQDLAEAVLGLEAAGIEGDVVEAGTALGGSAVVLARMKASHRRLRLFDAFGMIPPPTDEDGADVHERYDAIVSGNSKGIDGDVYYGYREDLLGEVTGNLQRFGLDLERDHIELVRGLYEDTMRIDAPVALAHIDCDWYGSVRTCLDAIDPFMVPAGRLVIDDYDQWSGCKTAVDEFLAGPAGAGYRTERKSRLHLVKA